MIKTTNSRVKKVYFMKNDGVNKPYKCLHGAPAKLTGLAANVIANHLNVSNFEYINHGERDKHGKG